MTKYEYFIVLALTVAGPAFLSGSKKLTLYKRSIHAIAAIGLPSLLFIAWDCIAVERGHWNFNPEFVTGIIVVNLPLEELLFFAVIPFAAIFTWECVKYFTRPPS